MIIAHYDPKHRQLMLVSAIPLILTALSTIVASVYLLIAPFGEKPPVLYWVIVALFVIFTIGVNTRALLSIMRARHNHLRVDAKGITFDAWQSFSLTASWDQIQSVERRASEHEEVTVLILNEASLIKKPLSLVLRQSNLTPPYPIVLDRFDGWPHGELYNTIATYIPDQLERSGV